MAQVLSMVFHHHRLLPSAQHALTPICTMFPYSPAPLILFHALVLTLAHADHFPACTTQLRPAAMPTHPLFNSIHLW